MLTTHLTSDPRACMIGVMLRYAKRTPQILEMIALWLRQILPSYKAKKTKMLLAPAWRDRTLAPGARRDHDQPLRHCSQWDMA
jgi:hypothetical protein